MTATRLKETPTTIAAEDDPWLTTEDLAARFKLSRDTIYGWTKTRHLPPGVKLGRSKHSPTRWKLSQIVEWEKNLQPGYSGVSRRERARKAAHERL